MLSWLYTKRALTGAQKPAPVAPSKPAPQIDTAAQQRAAAERAALKADARAKEADQARADWQPRLQAALGDDAALLQVAQAVPLLEIKLAAVEALAGEEALRHAERLFRSHDRKVHRAAKQGLETVVARRDTRARALTVIGAAAALCEAPLLPANQLVALDRDWQAMDESLLEPAQVEAFAQLRERLNAALNQRGELEQRQQRWVSEAKRVVTQLQRGCAQAAADGTASELASLIEAAHALQQTHIDAPTTRTIAQTLEAALQTAAQVQEHVACLAELKQPASEPPAEASTETHDPAGTSRQRWNALAPLPDAELSGLLNQHFDLWHRAQFPAPVAAPPKPLAKAAARTLSAEQRADLETHLQHAEAALAEGQLASLQQLLQSIDAALDAAHGVAPHDPLRTRQQALHAEHARLRGWQQWGGARARDDLVAEAEALARLTLLATDAQVSNAPKLRLKQHADSIQTLRKRWKELDRVGAAANQALWQRFDGALTVAHQPVAAQQAALKAARDENLATREALLAALDAVPVAAAPAGEDDGGSTWKEPIRALEHFQREWRQLGPLEHTVPSSARAALHERLRTSLERIEMPLGAARGVAEAARQQLIGRVETLLQELAEQPQPQSRDAMARVRELQAQWQQQARAVPLLRGVENALWTRFKAATDAVFAQRDAAANARDADLAANLAAREALLERLTSLRPDTPSAAIERTLAEVDRAWRQGVDLPRGAAAALETRLADAHAAALKCLAASAQVGWQAICDTLVAKLALCDERHAASADPSGLTGRWAALAGLPAAWERALAQRWAAPAASGPLSETAFNDLLLQLETALDLPATPERLAARRDLKLRAMKDALEGRRASSLDPARRDEWWAAALRQDGATAAQTERVLALVAALRQAPPGTLVPAPNRR